MPREWFMPTETRLVEAEYRPLRPLQVVGRIVDFLFGLLIVVLLVRFFLELINAAAGTGFFRFIRQLSDPFVAPFREIVPTTTLDGGYRLVWSLIVAVVAYAVLQAVIHAFLRLLARP
jgi:uncharacterized protein YggT (Ycf19 family)